MTTLIYTHDACLQHRPWRHHPEAPQLLLAVRQALQTPAFGDLVWREAPLGSAEQVKLVHDDDYFDWVHAASPELRLRALDGGDTVMSPGTLEAVLRCVGAACAGVDAVVAGEADSVLCATRPCGRHAETGRAMGLCVFNQAAVEALHARKRHGLKRVAVVDFDVHHGKGTEQCFHDDPDLFYGSSHQSPFYPGTGSRLESGVARNIVNIQLSRGCGTAEFRKGMSAELLPALRDFAPELLIISAGFDAHHLDPLGGLKLTDDDFDWVTRELLAVASASAGAKVVSMLEGGYSLEGLASGTAAHVRALMQA
jgi:acetoin utilization deacetylase AcuC-like enzyme